MERIWTFPSAYKLSSTELNERGVNVYKDSEPEAQYHVSPYMLGLSLADINFVPAKEERVKGGKHQQAMSCLLLVFLVIASGTKGLYLCDLIRLCLFVDNV